MKHSVIFIVIGCWLAIAGSASAQLHLDKGKVNIDATAGETVSGKLMINNAASYEVKVKVYLEDFVYQPPFDGSKKFMPAGTAPDSLAGWISYSPQEFALGPLGKKEISYVIKVPTDASGGRYGVLFIEQQEQGAISETGVKIVTRVGCLLFVETLPTSRRANLEQMNITTDGLKGEIVNNGNVIMIPKGTYYVVRSDGTVADRGEVSSVYLPPGQRAAVEMALAPDLRPDRYTAVVTFDLDGKDVLVKEVDFEKSDYGDSQILEIRD